jgi:hypothetical protein
MKTLKLFGALMMLFLFSSTSFAQVTAHATAMADIVTPINLTWEADLNFANVAVQAAVAGTVKLLPMASPATRQATAGCTLPVNTGTTPTAAQFSVQGEATYTYSITLPTTNTIKNQTGTGGETMIVNTFASSPTPTGVLDASGLQTLYVGATLNVGAGQTPGHYESITDFDVTVNYN